MAGAAVNKPRGDGVSLAAKPGGNGADGHALTIREFLPWHVIERKMSPGIDEPLVDPPDSGVYTSDQHRAANECDGAMADPAALSFKAYTVAELEARGIRADMSVGATRMSIARMAPQKTPWADVADAALVVARMAKTWALAPRPRPSPRDVLRAPVVAFTFALRAALRQVEWNKVGIAAGLGLGTFLFLLVAVMMAAELTDDLKPARASHVASGDSYTSAIVAAAHPTAAPRPAETTKAAGLDVSFEPAPAPTPTPRVARPSTAKGKGKGKKQAAKAEVFIP